MAVTEKFKKHMLYHLVQHKKKKICVSDNTTKDRNQLRICCSSDKFIISPMWLVDSMICCNSSVVCDIPGLHISPLEELLNGCEKWYPLNPGLWAKMANPIRIMAISVLCHLLADTWQICYQLKCKCYIYKHHHTTVVEVQGNSVY